MQELIKKLEKYYRKLISEFNEYDWTYISRYQKLSEDFIREFQNEVDWYLISEYQDLSEDFIQEFKNKISGF